jgi:hypothetical protein
MVRILLGLSAARAAGIVAAGALAGSASAAALMNEPFNTPFGVSIDGQGSGGGWGSELWSSTDDPGTVDSGSFKTLGSAASFAPGDFGGLDISNRTPQRSPATGKSEANRVFGNNTFRNRFTGGENEAWFSVLVDWDGGNFGYAVTNQTFDPSQAVPKLADDVGQTDLGLGFRFRSGTSDLVLHKWKDAGFDQTSADALTFTPGDVLLLVARLEWGPAGGQDVITLWSVSDAGGALTDFPSISMTTNINNSVLDRVAMYDNQRTKVDELRFGWVDAANGETSQDGLDSVTPGLAVIVPAPGVATLLGVGGLMVGRRRCRSVGRA